jgi:hypothetical protein
MGSWALLGVSSRGPIAGGAAGADRAAGELRGRVRLVAGVRVLACADPLASETVPTSRQHPVLPASGYPARVFGRAGGPKPRRNASQCVGPARSGRPGCRQVLERQYDRARAGSRTGPPGPPRGSAWSPSRVRRVRFPVPVPGRPGRYRSVWIAAAAGCWSAWWRSSVWIPDPGRPVNAGELLPVRIHRAGVRGPTVRVAALLALVAFSGRGSERDGPPTGAASARTGLWGSDAAFSSRAGPKSRVRSRERVEVGPDRF